MKEKYGIEIFKKESKKLITGINLCKSIESVRNMLLLKTTKIFRDSFGKNYPPAHQLIRMRDCSYALMNAFSDRSEYRTGFSLVKAFWDISKGYDREDLKRGFYAELINWVKGLEGRADFHFLVDYSNNMAGSGREKAIRRSSELDQLWKAVEERLDAYGNGLATKSIAKREIRRKKILNALGGGQDDWNNWKWHVQHIIKDVNKLKGLISIDDTQCGLIEKALKGKLPFGITPYYMMLMDECASENDRAIRAQVFPPESYVSAMISNREDGMHSFDYMLENDTSPIDRITRRYPGIIILKPIATCPQICVYCQRNWEIEQVMAPRSIAGDVELDEAVKWIGEHPAVKEVLITGGDPLILVDNKIESLLDKLAEVRSIDLIRIGSRTLVTLPMRITDRLAQLLGKYREPGRRDVAIMTHIEHPYEITPETAIAVDKLKRQGISVYNQQVYTFYVSRRFETTLLRILLRRIGIDPYYTFMPKGKEETNDYRVPLARILQEQKEEARLAPGLRRTDEAVFNVPGLGKNYLRAAQHRDFLTVLPDGARMYDFHPWEMNLASCQTYLYKDVPIINYLDRLENIGEKSKDYESIWYFF